MEINEEYTYDDIRNVGGKNYIETGHKEFTCDGLGYGKYLKFVFEVVGHDRFRLKEMFENKVTPSNNT